MDLSWCDASEFQGFDRPKVAKVSRHLWVRDSVGCLLTVSFLSAAGTQPLCCKFVCHYFGDFVELLLKRTV